MPPPTYDAARLGQRAAEPRSDASANTTSGASANTEGAPRELVRATPR
jgi:hypothetical protein